MIQQWNTDDPRPQVLSLLEGKSVLIEVRGRRLWIENRPRDLNDWANKPKGHNIGRVKITLGGEPQKNKVPDFYLPWGQRIAIPIPSVIRQVGLVWHFYDMVWYDSSVAGFLDLQLWWDDGDQLVTEPVPELSRPILGDFSVQSPSNFMAWRDANDQLWPPSDRPVVVDQARWWGGWLHTRPIVVPSIADTLTIATAANTLFDFVGPQAVLVVDDPPSYDLERGRFVHEITVSVSAATLVVIGGAGLTIGSPGAQEVIRWRAAAAGSQRFSFPGGMRVGAPNDTNGAKWRAYTSAPVTLDATIIGG